MGEVVIVSRHPATINYLKTVFPVAKVVSHVSSLDEIPTGALVIGNLPIHLIDKLINERGCRFVLVSLDIPQELRGKELNEQELKKYMRLFEISELKLSEFIIS